MIVEAPGNPFEDLRPLVEEVRSVLFDLSPGRGIRIG